MNLAERLTPRGYWRHVVPEACAFGFPVIMVLVSQEGFGFPLVAALSGCVLLPWRNRWPRVTFVLCLPGVVGGIGWPPAVVAMFALGRALPVLRQLIVWIVLITACALAPVFVTESLEASQYLLTVAFVLFVVLAPIALGALVTTRQQLRESVARLQRATAAEAYAKSETARAEERSRIAREIHDAVGHHVTLIAVEAAALAETIEDPTTKETAQRMCGMAREGLSEMRTALGLMTSDATQAVDLQTIPDLVASARDAGVEVRLINDLGERATSAPSIGRAAYRVVQEALTNVYKHAPGAGVTVLLRQEDESLCITVYSDAPVETAVDVARSGSGLEGLSERVQMVGGRFEAGPSVDGGFRLFAVLPGG